jgi:hypothetical protein
VEELKKKLADYFESWELAEYLKLSSAELIEAFEDEVEDKLEGLKELMGLEDEGS